MIELLLGPVTGLLGSAVTGVVSYFERQQQIEMKKLDHAHEVVLLDKQMQIRGQEMENELAIANLAADAEALKGSYNEAASYGSSWEWVNAVLKLTRPFLTIALMVAAVALAWFVIEDDNAQAEIVKQVVYLSGVAIGWWFGDRRKTSK